MLNYPLLLILFGLVLGGVPLVEDKPDDPDSEEFEKYTEEEERDAHIVTHALKRLAIRADFDKYPYVIKINTTKSDEIDKDRNEIMLQYITPKLNPKQKEEVDMGEAGPQKGDVQIKTSYIDMRDEIVVIPMGDRGLGYPQKDVHVVLRANKNRTLHYLNLAYVRRQLKRFSVEWGILDASLFGRNRLEQEFCRGTPCDIYHHMFGLCALVSHTCKEPLQGDPELINKFTWKTNMSPDSASGGGGGDGGEGPPSASNGQKSKKQGKPGKQRQQGGGGGGGGGGGEEVSQGDNGGGPPSSQMNKRGALEEKNSEKSHIPNSLDLLMLKRDDKETAPEKDSHFVNTLLKKRSTVKRSPSMKDREALLDCSGCEKIGGYYIDFEEEPEFSTLIGQLASKFKQDVAQDSDMLFQNEEVLAANPFVPYIGFGMCNLTDLEDLQANFTKEIEDLTKFFIASMRLSCHRESENRVRGLFTSKIKLLEIGEDYSVGISHASQILKYKILTIEEFRTGMAGTFLSAYINAYRQESKRFTLFGDLALIPQKGNNSTAEPKLSKGIQFMTSVVLRVMGAFTKGLNQHYIRGHRFVLRILRDKFNLVLITVAGSADSPKKETLINDLYRLMALKEFIIYGLGPTSKSGTSPSTAFKSFQAENEKRIKRLVDAYGII